MSQRQHDSERVDLTGGKIPLDRSHRGARPYQAPSSVCWGSVVDLTEGAGGVMTDFPLAGSKNA